MGTDPRDSLNRLIAAFENHFDVAQAGDLMDSQAMEQAEERLRDAFFTYDDVLFTRFDVELPFDLVDDDDDDLGEEDLDPDDFDDDVLDESDNDDEDDAEQDLSDDGDDDFDLEGIDDIDVD